MDCLLFEQEDSTVLYCTEPGQDVKLPPRLFFCGAVHCPVVSILFRGCKSRPSQKFRRGGARPFPTAARSLGIERCDYVVSFVIDDIKKNVSKANAAGDE